MAKGDGRLAWIPPTFGHGLAYDVTWGFLGGRCVYRLPVFGGECEELGDANSRILRID